MIKVRGLRQREELRYGPNGPGGDYGFYPTSNAGPPKPRGPKKSWPYRSSLDDQGRTTREIKKFFYYRSNSIQPFARQKRSPVKTSLKWKKRRGGI
tara:strand:- start:192 stop:479 length:288 start_codon:yes stop_codon:yes gene_type:complete